ncbi:Transaldolase A [Buchnera aphidicola (Neophyllaphis podocarpi)]|uniref:transaldolase n=1 Tax=Buchnera aphidicola TaxID=9 RepID=UPI0031B8970B
MSLLQSLKNFTTVVVDSSDINTIRKYHPYDATTNPSLILKSVNLKSYEHIINSSIKYAKKKGGNYKKQISNAADKVAVNFGIEILKEIPGRVSTEIDARLSFNTELCIKKSKKIIKMYEDSGVNRSKVLIKLAATWECILAAKELKKDNIQCNLTLVFSFAQARACAESGVFLISPFVGRIYDWYKNTGRIDNYIPSNDPGVLSVQKIYFYYKKYNYNTIIMGASFRNIEQILSLCGCDKLTISPELLEQLNCTSGIATEKLFYNEHIYYDKPKKLSVSDFYWQHNQDSMAVEKLSEGIRQFAIDQDKLETILSCRL